jgi:hypothetical protein
MAVMPAPSDKVAARNDSAAGPHDAPMSEHADAHHPAERGQRARPELDGHRFGEVALTRQAEHGLRHADHEAAEREHGQMHRPSAQRGRDGAPQRRRDDGPPKLGKTENGVCRVRVSGVLCTSPTATHTERLGVTAGHAALLAVP